MTMEKSLNLSIWNFPICKMGAFWLFWVLNELKYVKKTYKCLVPYNHCPESYAVFNTTCHRKYSKILPNAELIFLT